jgi:hypothetical protein
MARHVKLYHRVFLWQVHRSPLKHVHCAICEPATLDH